MNKTLLITLVGISVIVPAFFFGTTVNAETQEEKQEIKKSEEKVKTGDKTAQDKNDFCNCEAKKACHGEKKNCECDGKSCKDCSQFKDKDGKCKCDKSGKCGKHTADGCSSSGRKRCQARKGCH